MPRIEERLQTGYGEIEPVQSKKGQLPADVAFAAIRWAYARGYCDSFLADWEDRARVAAEAAQLPPL